MIPLSPSRSATKTISDFNLRSYLYVLSPITEGSELSKNSDVIIQSKTIKIKQTDYQFTKIFNGLSNFIDSSFTSVIPCIDKVINGETSTLVFCGEQSLNFANYLIGDTLPTAQTNRWPGLIILSMNQLLVSTRQKNISATITFSWFSIDSSSNEIISDILKKSSNAGSHSVDQLVLREQSKGKGMHVPNLWEVEITSPEDLEKVINHVIQSNNTLNKGLAHQILQLSYRTNTNEKDKDINGKLNIIILTSIEASKIINNNKINLNTSNISKSVSTKNNWVIQLEHILDWIDSKHAAPPFHKSRILLMLRDLLIGRQSGLIFCLINPDISSNAVHWIQLVNRMTSILTSNYLSSYLPQQTDIPTFKSKTPVANTSMSSSYAPTPRDVATDGKETGLSAAGSSVFTFSPTHLSQTQHSNQTNQKVSIKDALLSAKSVNSTTLSTRYSNPNTPSNNNNITDSNDYITKEREASLKACIQSQQKEIEKLRTQLAEQTNRANDLEDSRNSLIEQLKEEGAMLMKKDQERFKKALQDLRDYELYKQVIEATMQRMQTELNNYKQENQELIEAKSYNEKVARKNRSHSDKHLIELTSVKKQLSNHENKISELQKHIDKITKERDNLSLTLNKTKDDNEKQRQKYLSDLSTKDREISELKLNLEVALDDLMAEKPSGEYTNEQIESQKKAHTKTLESLMILQEENKTLKNKIKELQRKKTESAI